MRFGIGGALLAPILWRRGIGGLRLTQALALAWCGGIGFALFAYAGFALAPAGHGAVLLHGTLPLFTHLLTPRQAQIMRPAAIALIAGGIALMAADSLLGANPQQLLGDACLLLASLCWSAYGLRLRSSGLTPAHAASVVAVLSLVIFAPVYALWPGRAWQAAADVLAFQAVVQGVLIGAVSIFVYTRAAAELGAARMSLFTAAVPCVTTLSAIPLLGEVPTLAACLGLALVTLGLNLALRPRREDVEPITAAVAERK